MSSSFVFWDKNWKWAGFKKNFRIVEPFRYELSGKNAALNFDLSAQIRKISDHQLVWQFDLDAHTNKPDVIGGGMNFRFNTKYLGEPDLLPGNQGWGWGHRGGSRVELRFEPPLATVYFERNQKSQVRMFFYQGEVPQGHRRYTATLTISGDMAIEPTMAERFGMTQLVQVANQYPQLANCAVDDRPCQS